MTRRPTLAWLATLAAASAGCSERSAHDPFALMEGQGIYQAECAACHGARLEGQAKGQNPQPGGTAPAPPLDGSGRAWQQPRPQLAEAVKSGRVLPRPAADPASGQSSGQASERAGDTGMPAFGGKLSDAQIDNVLAWIESQWSPQTLQQRAALLHPR